VITTQVTGLARVKICVSERRQIEHRKEVFTLTINVTIYALQFSHLHFLCKTEIFSLVTYYAFNYVSHICQSVSSMYTWHDEQQLYIIPRLAPLFLEVPQVFIQLAHGSFFCACILNTVLLMLRAKKNDVT